MQVAFLCELAHLLVGQRHGVLVPFRVILESTGRLLAGAGLRCGLSLHLGTRSVHDGSTLRGGLDELEPARYTGAVGLSSGRTLAEGVEAAGATGEHVLDASGATSAVLIAVRVLVANLNTRRSNDVLVDSLQVALVHREEPRHLGRLLFPCGHEDIRRDFLNVPSSGGRCSAMHRIHKRHRGLRIIPVWNHTPSCQLAEGAMCVHIQHGRAVLGDGSRVRALEWVHDVLLCAPRQVRRWAKI